MLLPLGATDNCICTIELTGVYGMTNHSNISYFDVKMHACKAKCAQAGKKKGGKKGKNVSEKCSLADSGVTAGVFGEKRLNATRNTIKEALLKCIYVCKGWHTRIYTINTNTKTRSSIYLKQKLCVYTCVNKHWHTVADIMNIIMLLNEPTTCAIQLSHKRDLNTVEGADSQIHRHTFAYTQIWIEI